LKRKIFGIATLSERGQIVIPQEAREEFNLKPGDKLIIMSFGPKAGLMIIKAEELLEIFSEISKDLSEIEKFISILKEGKKDEGD